MTGAIVLATGVRSVTGLQDTCTGFLGYKVIAKADWYCRIYTHTIIRERIHHPFVVYDV